MACDSKYVALVAFLSVWAVEFRGGADDSYGAFAWLWVKACIYL